MSYLRNLNEIGAGIIGRAVTDTLYVSPEGSGTDGLTWATAFTTLQAALTAASTNGNDCTLICISPHSSSYDINFAGDPTYTGNYILYGTHRDWIDIKNTHASATSILKFTGKVALMRLGFDLGSGSNNGIIMTHRGFRLYHCQFLGKNLTGAATALHINNASTLKAGKIVDCNFIGEGKNHMTALRLNNTSESLFERLNILDCKIGIQIVHADSDYNMFCNLNVCRNGIGFDIDAGNCQHLENILFHENTVNVDDEVGGHFYNNIKGSFPINIIPDNLVGVTVNTHANPDTWGTNTQIRAAIDKPFRIVAIHLEPSNAEWYRIRFTDGTTYYDEVLFNANKREGLSSPSGTEFIFNKGIVISASAKSISGGNIIR